MALIIWDFRDHIGDIQTVPGTVHSKSFDSIANIIENHRNGAAQQDNVAFELIQYAHSLLVLPYCKAFSCIS